jgi:hypothetical protein
MEDNPSPSSVPLISAALNSQAALGTGWGLKHWRGLVGVCVSATVPFLIGLGGGVKMALVVIQLLFITAEPGGPCYPTQMLVAGMPGWSGHAWQGLEQACLSLCPLVLALNQGHWDKCMFPSECENGGVGLGY